MKKTVFSGAPCNYIAPQAEIFSIELTAMLLQSGGTESIRDDELVYEF